MFCENLTKFNPKIDFFNLAASFRQKYAADEFCVLI